MWRIGLSAPSDLDVLFDLLDADEQARAERFRFAQHSRRFIVAHAAVRCILAQRLAAAPGELRFSRNAHGKPFLSSHGGLLFSLSHSHELALCALAVSGELGVDVEWRRHLKHGDLARRFFAADEAAGLAGLAEEDQVAGFFACWTCKEAYVKAKGLGLSLPLHAFSVTTHPRQAPALLSSRHDPADVGPYRFWEIPVAPGYHAVLAYRGEAAAAPVCRDWQFPRRA